MGATPRAESGRWGRAARSALSALAMLVIAACVPMASSTPEESGGLLPVYSVAASAQTRVIDDFETVGAWSAHPSEGVELRISQDSGFAGRGMRLDFDFHGGTGYAIARRALPIDLPENWEFAFRMRADAPVNDLEFKLIDPSGDNVWWMNRRRFEYPREWQRIRTQKRQVEFAWGPKGGGEMDSLAQLEIVITAGTGGKGTVWIDDLTFREREPNTPYTLTPTVHATGSAVESPPVFAVDEDTGTVWFSAGEATLSLDFLREREMGGVVLHWDSAAFASDYVIEVSDDGARWEPLYTVAGGNGGRDPLYLPETETRHLRLRIPAGRSRASALREMEIMPAEWSQTPNAFFANLAKEAPRGAYPRYLAGEQSYWTVVGVSGDTRESTVNADGAVETGIGGPMIEPFLYTDGRLLSWADVRATQSLEKGYLPIPSVDWDAQPLRMTVTAIPAGEPERSAVYVRYRVENRGATATDATLFLALRPFQVNPSWQFLNVQGGVARVREIAFDDTTLVVNGAPVLRTLGDAHRFGAAPFDGGDVVDYLRQGRVPDAQRVTDPRGFASAALAYRMTIEPGRTYEVLVGVPLHGAASMPLGLGYYRAECESGEYMRWATEKWEAELNRFTLRLPAAMHGEEIANTLRSQLAYILINRDGPSIQPGSRSYDRSWIRDGSLTSAALLRLGHADEVRAFAEWYAPHQRPNGYVPCCVSLRGADPVPEHDSHGQLIYLVAEYHRQTGDRAFLQRMWPHVARAVAFIDTLRHERMTPEYQAPEKRAYYGLVPQSISHEGYSAKPMHSYWDDFFVSKGLDDAVYVAQVLGRDADRARFAAIRDAFRRDLLASLGLAMRMHGIDYLPGSVELGDFDATSTTVGLVPAGLEGELPAEALRNTFERYYRQSIRARLDGAEWDGYTPYEWRTVGTFVRLGWKERAHEAIGLFFGHRRPAAWNQWAEVVFRDPASPRFIGDMPHTWVGSDFIRSVLDLFAYERAADGALVVGAGVPEAWVREAPGVEMAGLRTYRGPLDLRMRAEGQTVRVTIGGGLRVPPGGIVLRTPLDRPIRRATVNGRPVRVDADAREIVVRASPANVVLEH